MFIYNFLNDKGDEDESEFSQFSSKKTKDNFPSAGIY